jgi:Holliday junction resolvasome RuvABC endonuclease subunit
VIVLGVDPGLAHMGAAVVDREAPGKFRLLESGSITTSPDDAITVRLQLLASHLQALFARNPIDVVLIEKPSTIGLYGRENGDSSAGLKIERVMTDFHLARGAILVTCAYGCRRVLEVGASKVSKPDRAKRNLLVFPDFTKRTSEHERDAVYMAWAAPIIELPRLPKRRAS